MESNNTGILIEMKQASNHWAKIIKKALADKFGENRIGHCIILFGFRSNPLLTIVTDADNRSLAHLLRELADKLEKGDKRLIY